MQLTSRRPWLQRGNSLILSSLANLVSWRVCQYWQTRTTALGACSHCRQRQCKSCNKTNAINKTADRQCHRNEPWPPLPPIISVRAISTSSWSWFNVFKINGLVHKLIHSHLHQLIQTTAFQCSLRLRQWDNKGIFTLTSYMLFFVPWSSISNEFPSGQEIFTQRHISRITWAGPGQHTVLLHNPEFSLNVFCNTLRLEQVL